jgi:GMP synthase-like glutamine amidotransferase
VSPDGPTLWVIDPSLRNPEDQGIGEILAGWPGGARIFRPSLSTGDGPKASDGHDADAVVLMGSAASVHDEHAWLPPLGEWLAPIVRGDARVPLLGICFGHQLLAHLAGAEVGWIGPGRAKRVGVETSRLDGGRLLPGHHDLRVVVSHREEVKSVPAGYRSTATRGPIAIDGLEHESLPLFAFQFHPEAREDFAARAGIVTTAIDDRVRADSRRLLDAFVKAALPG